jgi:hypothetical protein
MLWLACYTQGQIAEMVGMSQPGVVKVLSQNESFRFVIKPGEFAVAAHAASRFRSRRNSINVASTSKIISINHGSSRGSAAHSKHSAATARK